MDALEAFEVLSSETGIVLPILLRKLLASGKTGYGPDWQSTWRERMLRGEAPLSSLYDFEWIDVSEARNVIEKWLNPRVQNGKSFLPFAQSGAGDAYCLMSIDGESVGVALIHRDEEVSHIGYISFDDFVIVRLLETLSDLEHLTDDFTEEEILQCIKSDIFSVTDFMTKQFQNYLRPFCGLPLMPRPFQHGPRALPINGLSLISQEQLKIELEKFKLPSMAPFKVVARWEIVSISEGKPTVSSDDWRTYALEPKKKLLAIQIYSKEFGVNLSEAKLVIDRYVDEFAKGT
jgi:hypothetical protein